MENSTKEPLFTGVATALVTPFKDGNLDLMAYRKLLHQQKLSGVAALVIAGTTGESPTLTEREIATLLDIAREEVGASMKLILGTGGNHTENVLKKSREAASNGADGLLVVTPYYNKGTKNGIIRHYLTIADAVDLPMILYNVPSRTGVDLTLDILDKLSEHPRIVALKEANGNIDKTAETIAALGDRLTVYSGNDSQILPILALGGKGVISVISNVLPRETAALCRAYFEGDNRQARLLQIQLTPLIKLLFAETNPAPIKAALEIASIARNELRLPMAPIDDTLYEKIRCELQKWGIGA